jgi:hypothetical protein
VFNSFEPWGIIRLVIEFLPIFKFKLIYDVKTDIIMH